MPMRNNVLGRQQRPTTKSYQAAIKKIVLAVQKEHGLNDPELAERLGCSKGTVENARNERGCLNGVTLANVEFEFGTAAIDPFLELGGSRAMPLDGVTASMDAPVALSAALHLIIKMTAPNSPGGRAIVAAEVEPHLAELIDARTALDGLIDMASQSANGRRPLRAVADTKK